MALRTVIWLLSLIVIASTARAVLAQDQAPEVDAKTVGPQDLSRANADPIGKLEGLWQVDRVDGRAPSDTLRGRVLRIDRQSVTTLTLGTCINPSFAEQLGSISVACLGQTLASASWDPGKPGTIQWSEGDLRAVLHRLSGTEALQAVPAEDEGAGDDQGTDEAQ